ncbi:MAG TPA: hypothetical protein VF773_11945 [Verrucomicrobiae bacterium]
MTRSDSSRNLGRLKLPTAFALSALLFIGLLAVIPAGDFSSGFRQNDFIEWLTIRWMLFVPLAVLGVAIYLLSKRGIYCPQCHADLNDRIAAQSPTCWKCRQTFPADLHKRALEPLAPLMRLRLLCAAAIVLHVIGVAILLLEGIRGIDPRPLVMSLLLTVATNFGVALLYRPALLAFPLAAIYQAATIAMAIPAHVPFAGPEIVLAGLISVAIGILIFTTPTKKLFFQTDPDLPVR